MFVLLGLAISIVFRVLPRVAEPRLARRQRVVVCVCLALGLLASWPTESLLWKAPPLLGLTAILLWGAFFARDPVSLAIEEMNREPGAASLAEESRTRVNLKANADDRQIAELNEAEAVACPSNRFGA